MPKAKKFNSFLICFQLDFCEGKISLEMEVNDQQKGGKLELFKLGVEHEKRIPLGWGD